MIDLQLEFFAAEDLVEEIEPEASYWPFTINAPVFGATGTATLSLSLIDFPGSASGKLVTELGHTVSRAADEITAVLSGSQPIPQ